MLVCAAWRGSPPRFSQVDRYHAGIRKQLQFIRRTLRNRTRLCRYVAGPRRRLALSRTGLAIGWLGAWKLPQSHSFKSGATICAPSGKRRTHTLSISATFSENALPTTPGQTPKPMRLRPPRGAQCCTHAALHCGASGRREVAIARRSRRRSTARGPWRRRRTVREEPQ